MNEIDELERAIAALESQRASLGDVAVDTAVAGLRRRLAELSAPEPPAQPEQRKLVTVLFADIPGLAAASERLDPEDLQEFLDACFQHCRAAIVGLGGWVEPFVGDAVMGVFGLPAAHEDDPQRAIRAALAIQEAFAELARRFPVPGRVCIGIHTGTVLADLSMPDAREGGMVVGDTVNLASRLQHAAPPGAILISHDTYRHVRGLFDVQPQAPLRVKGKRAPIQTYVVLHAVPRARRAPAGTAGRMIGREAELRVLQDAWRAVQEQGAPQLVTVVGDAGVGKSRLLEEFARLAEPACMFRGRAAPETQHIPYSLLRDLFCDAFGILESDSAAAAREKFEAGASAHLAAERAHLAGHLVGFDFSATEAVRSLAGDPSLATLALADLLAYFRGISADRPALLLLEDLHWADNPSLDLLARLARELSDRRLLVVSAARPALYERRPDWGAADRPQRVRLELEPLSPGDSAALAAEILSARSGAPVPASVRDLVVRTAEGNPYYVEELIQMLIEDGAIASGAEGWRVERERLQPARVPPTLVAVLQARLDSLPPAERALLQRAAVIGRRFWDLPLAELRAAGDRDLPVEPALAALQARALVFPSAGSAFAGAREYVFKHTLLREVAYETVLLKQRRAYHRQAAGWLEANGGERLNEYAGLIADHYERAGARAPAVAWLRRAGDLALQTSAFAEALGYFERALTWVADGDAAGRAALLGRAGKAHQELGDYERAAERLRAALDITRAVGDECETAAALCALSMVFVLQGTYAEARASAEEALALARAAGDTTARANALRQVGVVCHYQNDSAAASVHYAESLALYRELGNRPGIATCLNNLGAACTNLGDYAAAVQYYQESLALHAAGGNRWGIAACRLNLGWTYLLQGDAQAARAQVEESLALFEQIGDRDGIAVCRVYLGHAAVESGDAASAERCYREALAVALAIHAIPRVLDVLTGLARLWAQAGRHVAAAELLGLALNHPAASGDVALAARPALAMLRAALPAGELEAALERGRTLDLMRVLESGVPSDPSPP